MGQGGYHGRQPLVRPPTFSRSSGNLAFMNEEDRRSDLAMAGKPEAVLPSECQEAGNAICCPSPGRYPAFVLDGARNISDTL